jgi:hypothetical protein
MKIIRTTDQSYAPYAAEHGVKGIERADLWRDGQDVAFDLFRIKKGADYAEHIRDSWEIMFMVSDKIDLSGKFSVPEILSSPNRVRAMWRRTLKIRWFCWVSGNTTTNGNFFAHRLVRSNTIY